MVSTDSPSNLAPHDTSNPAAVIEELMFVSPTPQHDHRRVGGKAVTILPRPSAASPPKQTSPSPPPNAHVLAAAQAQAVAASQPLTNPAVQHLQQHQPTPTMKCQTNKLGSRKMTHEIEEEVLSNWGEHVTEYYEGIRRRVFKKIALKLNEMLNEEPFYTEKQVENKITYMEKRYKSVKDKYSNFTVASLSERSMRTQVERMFPLFFKVHDIIGRRTAMTLAKAAVTVAAIETSGQPMHVQPDLSAANRGRKRKRTINGITQLDVKGDQLLPDSDTPIPDVPLLEDSDEVADVADVMESDGSPPNSFVKRRKKPNLADPKRSGKSNAKNPSPKDSSSSVAVLKTFLAHIENDEKQRKDMLEVMRSDLHLKQAHLDIEKKNTHDKTTLAKAAELRKLAEVYAGIDDKRIAKELLEESYDLIAKV